ncbi:hypothetical protein GQ600_15666 [Phytophthora cactorum]|nr:hypothetical protein GQ600_15666 [Phytophthora cactorum]
MHNDMVNVIHVDENFYKRSKRHITKVTMLAAVAHRVGRVRFRREARNVAFRVVHAGVEG